MNKEKLISSLKNYYNLLFPLELEKDEYIRLFFTSNKYDQPIAVFIKNFEEFQNTIDKYNHFCNCFVNLSTTKGKNGTAEYLFKQHVLALDFDRKDFNYQIGYMDILNIVKSKFPNLYYHCVIDSGNGFHIYYAIETCEDHERIADLSKYIASECGADTKACLATQILRIPTTFNLKNEQKKPVSTIYNSLDNGNIKRNKLSQFESCLSKIKLPSKVSQSQTFDSDSPRKYYCINRVLNEGVPKGIRNFWLGRITKYLNLIGYPEKVALKKVLKWNDLCSPPKTENEIVQEFKTFWEINYNLLGCKLKDPAKQSYLEIYCDKYLCQNSYSGSYQANQKDSEYPDIIKVDNKYWGTECLRKFDGFHFLLVIVLQQSIANKALSYNEIKNILRCKANGRIGLSEKTLRQKLKDLCRWNHLEMYKQKGNNMNFYKYKEIGNFGRGYTYVSVDINTKLIDRVISQTEYKIYLFILYSIQKATRVTYDDIYLHLNINKSNLTAPIKNLVKNNIIEIQKVYTERNSYYYRYKLLC